METKIDKRKITIINKKDGSHVFGPIAVHPNGPDGKPDRKQLIEVRYPALELHSAGSPKDHVEMSVEQFRLYEDDLMRERIDNREFAVLVDGVDLRPDLARREKPVQKAGPASAIASAAAQEASVLAELLGDEPKAE